MLEGKFGAGIPKTVRCYIQLRSRNSSDDTGVKLYWLLTFPWTVLAAWKGETCCIGNRRSLIKLYTGLHTGERTCRQHADLRQRDFGASTRDRIDASATFIFAVCNTFWASIGPTGLFTIAVVFTREQLPRLADLHQQRRHR